MFIIILHYTCANHCFVTCCVFISCTNFQYICLAVFVKLSLWIIKAILIISNCCGIFMYVRFFFFLPSCKSFVKFVFLGEQSSQKSMSRLLGRSQCIWTDFFIFDNCFSSLGCSDLAAPGNIWRVQSCGQVQTHHPRGMRCHHLVSQHGDKVKIWHRIVFQNC